MPATPGQDFGSIFIQYGATGQVVETLFNASNKIEALLADTHDAVRQWAPNASGNAAASFEAKFREWQTMLDNAQKTLLSHAGLLDEIGSAYQGFDRRLADSWDGMAI
ncbi:hypothetical protein AB0E83_24375 [Streptomyces sp. NPDC035033]|uniref:WXG100 family type VII secretion target n=1 Tax=Streptomyces sp. NPDC035033 TaxID=3155368 RepID=UPI0033D96C53